MCLEKVGVGVDLLLGPPPHHRVIVLDVNVMHVQWRVPNGDVIMGDSPANILLDTVTLMQHGAQLCSVEIMPLTWMAAHRANPECGDSLIAALIKGRTCLLALATQGKSNAVNGCRSSSCIDTAYTDVLPDWRAEEIVLHSSRKGQRDI
eukprot:CAMPEP_0119347922 /NCGR_PEP_ID=MMETSP1333-20130426/108776_1 /TAXON_ID=418940 /ORGANISM="Scyphosphaera apsteinii, Strain RCC1455" /LENGTH=148 /DNA_ID=CAMNT_0007360485 /DNA_START=1083 /DNA_END=1530 /DNA_ORIENTATION=+